MRKPQEKSTVTKSTRKSSEVVKERKMTVPKCLIVSNVPKPWTPSLCRVQNEPQADPCDLDHPGTGLEEHSVAYTIPTFGDAHGRGFAALDPSVTRKGLATSAPSSGTEGIFIAELASTSDSSSRTFELVSGARLLFCPTSSVMVSPTTPGSAGWYTRPAKKARRSRS